MKTVRALSSRDVKNEKVIALLNSLEASGVEQCWETHKHTKSRYIPVDIGGRSSLLHRVSYAWYVEDIPERKLKLKNEKN